MNEKSLFKTEKNCFLISLDLYGGVVGFSEPNSSLSDIVDVAISADESITQNPVGSEPSKAEVESGDGAVSVSKFKLKQWDVEGLF